jgi:hypothetical protein
LQAVLEGRPFKRVGFDDDDVEDVLDPARLAVSEADAALVIRSRFQQLPRVGFIVCRLEGEIVIGPVGEAQSKSAKHSTSLERSIALGLGSSGHLADVDELPTERGNPARSLTGKRRPSAAVLPGSRLGA